MPNRPSGSGIAIVAKCPFANPATRPTQVPYATIALRVRTYRGIVSVALPLTANKIRVEMPRVIARGRSKKVKALSAPRYAKQKGLVRDIFQKGLVSDVSIVQLLTVNRYDKSFNTGGRAGHRTRQG